MAGQLLPCPNADVEASLATSCHVAVCTAHFHSACSLYVLHPLSFKLSVTLSSSTLRHSISLLDTDGCTLHPLPVDGMHSFQILSALVAVASAQYELQSTFAGETFFDNFNFYDSWDPTYGFVQYVSKEAAEGFGMINVTDTSASWGVDTTGLFNATAPLGRPSIRITTIESWTHGLFIVDLAHMPANGEQLSPSMLPSSCSLNAYTFSVRHLASFLGSWFRDVA